MEQEVKVENQERAPYIPLRRMSDDEQERCQRLLLATMVSTLQAQLPTWRQPDAEYPYDDKAHFKAMLHALVAAQSAYQQFVANLPEQPCHGGDFDDWAYHILTTAVWVMEQSHIVLEEVHPMCDGAQPFLTLGRVMAALNVKRGVEYALDTIWEAVGNYDWSLEEGPDYAAGLLAHFDKRDKEYAREA